MAITLLALLGAALLLPGIIAARTFYFAAHTKEFDEVMPSMSTTDGLSLIGLFALVVHYTYIAMLRVVAALPSWTDLPVADPYRYLSSNSGGLQTLDDTLSLFSGLLFLSLLAIVVGYLSGLVMLRSTDRSMFYGPLNTLVASGRGDRNFITAFVLSKVTEQERPIAYEGTVVSLLRDADRFPSKLVLRDVAVFQPSFGDEKRDPDRDLQNRIPLMTFDSSEWHNLALTVYSLVPDDEVIEGLDTIPMDQAAV